MPQEKVTVTLTQGTRIAGESYERGDEVEVYEHEASHLIVAGMAEGDPVEAMPESLKDAGQQEWHRGATGRADDPDEEEEVRSPDADAPEDQRPSPEEATPEDQE